MAQRKKFFFFVVFFCLIILGELGYLYYQGQIFSPEKELERLKKNNEPIALALRTQLASIIRTHGILGAIALVNIAMEKENLSLVECHPLLHAIGHSAYDYYKKDMNAMAAPVSNACFSAYQHGVEAQIAIEERDPAPLLDAFCQSSRKVYPQALCFHGAGHAFLQISANVSDALARCDRLAGTRHSKNADIPNCYTGVFSEYGNRVTNFDSDRGTRIPGPALVEFPYAYPLEFCATLGKKYQASCDTQLTKILENLADINGTIRACTVAQYTHDTQMRCMYILGYHYAAVHIEDESPLTPPLGLIPLSQDLRRQFISGVRYVLGTAKLSGISKNLLAFCASLSVSDDSGFCARP